MMIIAAERFLQKINFKVFLDLQVFQHLGVVFNNCIVERQEFPIIIFHQISTIK